MSLQSLYTILALCSGPAWRERGTTVPTQTSHHCHLYDFISLDSKSSFDMKRHRKIRITYHGAKKSMQLQNCMNTVISCAIKRTPVNTYYVIHEKMFRKVTKLIVEIYYCGGSRSDDSDFFLCSFLLLFIKKGSMNVVYKIRFFPVKMIYLY